MPINPSNTAGIPGFDNLSTSASSIIQNLLSGLPSPDESRLDNAYFGAGTGLDSTSPFLANRGRDLYGKRAGERQQQGIENLLKMLGTYSGTVAPTAGQEMQGNQFNRSFNYRQQQDMLDRSDRERAEQDLLRGEQSAKWRGDSLNESYADWVGGPYAGGWLGKTLPPVTAFMESPEQRRRRR